MNLWNWAGWLAAFVATVFAVRATVRFDLNAYLKDRREHLKEKIRSLCPHVNMAFHNEQPAVRSTFVSPPGTVSWHCQECGYTVYDQRIVDEQVQFWATNPDKLVERIKQIDNLAKKLG